MKRHKHYCWHCGGKWHCERTLCEPFDRRAVVEKQCPECSGLQTIISQAQTLYAERKGMNSK